MKRSPFEFDISVSADKKRKSRSRTSSRGMSGAFETSSRVCDKPGCEEPGKYRAPKSPDNTNEYFWFCMDHVREYNVKWNFFENHSDAELQEQFDADKVWERPTRPLRDADNPHPNSEAAAWARLGIDDPMEVLGTKGTANRPMQSRRLPSSERKALDILDAKDHWTKGQLRRQYKALVKDLHPDMNGGKRDDEDRLQEVVWAWEQLKDSRSFKD